jgi:hypothetical protein
MQQTPLDATANAGTVTGVQVTVLLRRSGACYSMPAATTSVAGHLTARTGTLTISKLQALPDRY